MFSDVSIFQNRQFSVVEAISSFSLSPLKFAKSLKVDVACHKNSCKTCKKTTNGKHFLSVNYNMAPLHLPCERILLLLVAIILISGFEVSSFCSATDPRPAVNKINNQKYSVTRKNK